MKCLKNMKLFPKAEYRMHSGTGAFERVLTCALKRTMSPFRMVEVCLVAFCYLNFCRALCCEYPHIFQEKPAAFSSALRQGLSKMF